MDILLYYIHLYHILNLQGNTRKIKILLLLIIIIIIIIIIAIELIQC